MHDKYDTVAAPETEHKTGRRACRKTKVTGHLRTRLSRGTKKPTAQRGRSRTTRTETLGKTTGTDRHGKGGAHEPGPTLLGGTQESENRKRGPTGKSGSALGAAEQQIMHNPAQQRNARAEPIQRSLPATREGVNLLTTRHKKHGIKTRDLTSPIVGEPIDRVRTPRRAAQVEEAS